MDKNNEKIVFWIIGIVLFLIVATRLPFAGRFAIVQTTVCSDGVTNYYSFDGNLLDSKGSLDATNYGAVFVNGKFGQAIEFNGTNYISFPSISSNLSVYMWINNYSASSGWYYTSLPLSSTFGLGWNASIDEIVVGVNVSGLSGVQACYQQTTYENVSCQEYATSLVADQTTGCLNYSAGNFPNCTYKWENKTTFKLENNVCKKNYYCVSGYTQTECSALIQTPTTTAPVTTTTTTTTTETTQSLSDKLKTEVFKIGDYSITPIHLIIALIIILLILYLMGVFKGK